MGELRERFWELPLEALNRAEWEALCDGCGRCCLHKLENEDNGEVIETNVACRLLDPESARCTDYKHRKAFVPDCLRLTPRLVEHISWLPPTCAYRLRGDGKPLPSWHYLLTGSRETMVRAGVSVAGRVVSEDDAGPLEHHIVEWPKGAAKGVPERMIDWLRRGQAEPSVTLGGREVPLMIRRHPRATRLTMRLAPDGSQVRVTLPKWGRTSDAMVFAHKRIDWLEQQLAAVPRAAPLEPGGTVLYRGRAVTIAWEPRLPRKPSLTGERLSLGGPAETVARRVHRWLETEALRLLGEDLAHYCARAGVTRPQVRVSRAVRRWGSCSGNRDGARCIRINWRLVQAPDEVRRSVVAHEVAHLVHFDHSPAFRALLHELFESDLEAANSWLKHHGRALYAACG